MLKAKETKKRLLGKRLMDGEALTSIVQDMPEIIPDYKKIKQSYDAYSLDTTKPTSTEGMKGLWIHGPAGTGKSYAARQLSLNQYNEEPFVMIGTKWLDGYKG